MIRPERFAVVLSGCPDQPAHSCQHGESEKPVVLNAFSRAMQQRQLRIDQAQGVLGKLRRAEARPRVLQRAQQGPAAVARGGQRFIEIAAHDRAPPGGLFPNHRKKMLSVRQDKAFRITR
jgi:hypothetical protein